MLTKSIPVRVPHTYSRCMFTHCLESAGSVEFQYNFEDLVEFIKNAVSRHMLHYLH